MYRIGTLKWKGGCKKHRMYNPEMGEGAIKAGCQTCYALLELHKHIAAATRLMRTIAPPIERRPRKTKAERAQMSLLEAAAQ